MESQHQTIDDFVIVTHLPAFYKVNLYQALARQLKLHVIFVASGSEIRHGDFSRQLEDISHEILFQGSFESRPKLKTLWRIYCALRRRRYRYLLLGGWDLYEYWLAAFVSPKSKNRLIIESTLLPGARRFWKLALKRLFLSQISSVMYSGQAQKKLLRYLGCHLPRHKTYGVGLMQEHYPSAGDSMRIRAISRFVYVGRFSEEKGILLLLEAFKAVPQLSLTCIGEGPLREKMQKLAGHNVQIQDYVPNEQLPHMLKTHDVLILPSHAEAWGLIVEEALRLHLPVIVSSAVGCGHEWVKAPGAGEIFEAGNQRSLLAAIYRLCNWEHYAQISTNIQNINFEMLKHQQISAYVETA